MFVAVTIQFEVRKMSFPYNDALEKYIAENTYDDFDLESYSELKTRNLKFPEDTELHRRLRLMEKKRSRMAFDQLSEKEFRERQRSFAPENKLQDGFSCQNVIAGFNRYISEKEQPPKFVDVFTKFQRMKGDESDAAICRRVKVDQYVLTRMKNEERPANRDVLWRLAISLRLNLDETEELFNSCGLSTHGFYHISVKERHREIAYEYFLKNEKYDYSEIFSALISKNLMTKEEGD